MPLINAVEGSRGRGQSRQIKRTWNNGSRVQKRISQATAADIDNEGFRAPATIGRTQGRSNELGGR
jgi:hypothetical protein